MGSSTENSAFKITHNPQDLTCVPGEAPEVQQQQLKQMNVYLL